MTNKNYPFTLSNFTSFSVNLIAFFSLASTFSFNSSLLLSIMTDIVSGMSESKGWGRDGGTDGGMEGWMEGWTHGMDAWMIVVSVK